MLLRKTLAVAGLALLAAVPASGARSFLLGATDPYIANGNVRGSQREAARLAAVGLDSVRLMVPWTQGNASVDPAERNRLENAATAAKAHGLRLIVALYPAGSSQTPLTDTAQAQFASWAASIARSVPSVRDFVVGNQPNLNRFWLPQYGPNGEDVAAPAFVSLLAQSYDALKAVSPAIRVWGCGCARSGSDNPKVGRATHSPVAFITDLGAAYRASGRTKPIMDGLAYHPYMENSSIPPSHQHADTSTTLTIADYGRLVALLGQAFDGTAQPGSTLPILYDEFGVEAIPAPSEAKYYTGSEAPSIKPVSVTTQSQYYASAVKLAYCEPNVAGLELFLFEDEHALSGWQSGLYYANAKPKPSLATVKWAAGRTRGRGFSC